MRRQGPARRSPILSDPARAAGPDRRPAHDSGERRTEWPSPGDCGLDCGPSAARIGS